ncbi:hypothetical protein ABRY94_11690 [Castellaniella ginsengisoli]|uniref:Uncharacterized protein n=1 Tax=Castellaniella ginsengisoli TaxID=546114 RepID=A0AB39EMU3_9BURK
MRKVIAGIGLVALLVGAAVLYRDHLAQEYRASVLAKLADPGSAQFRNETFISPWGLANGTLCGEVNAKNELGGYVGYKPFYVYDDSNTGNREVRFYKSGDSVCDLMKNDVPWWWIRW